MGLTRRGGQLAFAAVLLLALSLQLAAIWGQSLTMDEPYHLLAGEQALRFGTNGLNYEHPPLVKLLAALPMRLEAGPPIWSDWVPVSSALARMHDLFSVPERANRIRRRARLTLLLSVGLPWLVGCYLLGRLVGGPGTGLALLSMIGLSAVVIPFVSLVQTDAALGLAFTLGVIAAWSYVRRPTPALALALGASLGLAVAAKHSGLLLAPAVVLALVIAPGRTPLRALRDGAVTCALAALVALLPLQLANRAYDPERGGEAIRSYCANRGTLMVEGELAPLERRLLGMAAISPAVAQTWLGVVGIAIQNRLAVYPTYAFGEVRSRGRWWYFPAVLAVKLPLVLLAASLVAAWQLAPRLLTRGRRERGVWVVIAAAGVYLAFAITSSYNLGSRHLLPILPLLLLPAAWWVGRSSRRWLALTVLLSVEALCLAPGWMSSTNTWWLGDRNPSRFALGAGDLEYKQSFLLLGRETRARGIHELGVVLPGASTPELQASIPGARSIAPHEAPAAGWYAISVWAELLVRGISEAPRGSLYAEESRRQLAGQWGALLDRLEVARQYGIVAGTFRLVRLLPSSASPDAAGRGSHLPEADLTILGARPGGPVSP